MSRYHDASTTSEYGVLGVRDIDFTLDRFLLRRYRLHDAAAVPARERHQPWADVAAGLGDVDQPHVIRDFTAAIGMTPVAHAHACGSKEALISA